MRKRERERLKEKKRDFSQRLENHGEYSIKNLRLDVLSLSLSLPLSLTHTRTLSHSYSLTMMKLWDFKRVREAIITISADKSSKSILAKFKSRGQAEKKPQEGFFDASLIFDPSSLFYFETRGFQKSKG